MALDGSERSLETVRYIARFKPFQKMDIVLLHVLNSVPECYYDLEKVHKAVKVATPMRAWEAEQKKMIQAYMQRAKEILHHHGFEADRIEIMIRKRKQGIARDIIREAGNGYDAVIIRRRGLGAMRPVVVGSVAAKLIEKLTFVPVLIAGRRAPNDRVLVGLDGSACALRALDFVAQRLGGRDYHVHLLNVIRGRGTADLTSRRFASTAECVAATEAEIDKVLAGARRRLEAEGFAPEQITTQIIKGVVSRAAAIAEEAKRGNYGTIVLGRRGQSSVKDFFIGRVTNKVIVAARQHSVWVVT
jgi:nucleotide-binding universal stress UspA family protein